FLREPGGAPNFVFIGQETSCFSQLEESQTRELVDEYNINQMKLHKHSVQSLLIGLFILSGISPLIAQMDNLTDLPAPPPGMANIPAGAFTMGDTLEGDDDAVPIQVTV